MTAVDSQRGTEPAGRPPDSLPSGPGRPRLLLLHGYFSGRAVWSRVAREMSEDCDLVIPDLLGYGGSRSHEPGYSLERVVHHLAAIVETERPTHVVGHSMGGLVALALDGELPGVFKGLGATGLPVFASTEEGTAHQCRRGLGLRAAMGTLPVSHGACTVISRTRRLWYPFGRLCAPRQPRGIILSAFDHSQESHVAGLGGIVFADLAGGLADRASAPVSLLHGTRDDTAPFRKAWELAQEHEWRFWAVPGASHHVIVERPVTVANWIRGTVLAAGHGPRALPNEPGPGARAAALGS